MSSEPRETTALNVGTKAEYGASDQKSASRARAAYASGDVDASIAEHKKRRTPEEHDNMGSEYIKSIVFGGLDGIMTTFAIVAAAAGANETWHTILVFGFANKFADAFAMGFGEYTGGVAELDQAKQERAREEWEVENNIQGEIDEMIEIYEEKGFPHEDAKTMVEILAKDKSRFVNQMMVDELGIIVDTDDDHTGPMKQGLVMFASFVLFGFFPLAAYMFGVGQGVDMVFYAACAITGLGLMALGGAKGYLTGQSMTKMAMQMLATGAFSGATSYYIGVAVTYILSGHKGHH